MTAFEHVQRRHLSEGVQERMQRDQQSHEAIWNDAVAHTRERSPASFDQWFSGVQYDGLTDGVLSLRARDEFVREWVDDHFLPTLTDFMRDKTGFSIQVAWSVDSALEYAQFMLANMSRTEDAREGFAAFNQRRPPTFTGN